MKLAARVLPYLKPTPGKLGALLGLFLVAAGSAAFIVKRGYLMGQAFVYPPGYNERTASGETYNPRKFTFGAANSNFRRYAWVKITNRNNNKVSFARRNDELRAPDSYSYLVRLSHAVARELYITDTSSVLVEVVPEVSVPARYFSEQSYVPQTPPGPKDNPGNGMNPAPLDDTQYGKVIDLENQPTNVKNFYGVQVISLRNHDDALAYSQRPNVLGLGEDIYIEPFRQPSGTVMYRVLIGKFATRTEAQTVTWQLRRQGFSDCTLQMYQ
jgi:cell division septation protein DedD